jgi:hypothetical protein
MDDIQKVLNLLFDTGDQICVSRGPYSSHSMPQESVLSGEVTLVSPNQKVPHQKLKSYELTHLCINPVLGFRSDKNATKLRTFLLEIDTGTLSAQYNYLKSLGVPISCMIFSGGKSLHCAITLEEPLPDKKTYDLIAQWILNIGTLFDTACKNPTRCIRFPGIIRPETGKEQKLIEMKSRIKIEDLMNWLNKYPSLMPKEREKKNNLTGEFDYDKLSSWAKYQLKNGIDFSGGRNKTWYALFCDFALAGYPEEEAVEILSNFYVEESSFKEKEWLMTATSAYKNKG